MQADIPRYSAGNDRAQCGWHNALPKLQNKDVQPGKEPDYQTHYDISQRTLPSGMRSETSMPP
jgi:hypothetical protein